LHYWYGLYSYEWYFEIGSGSVKGEE
jgi:hypothetical protein